MIYFFISHTINSVIINKLINFYYILFEKIVNLKKKNKNIINFIIFLILKIKNKLRFFINFKVFFKTLN
jgi:hypothetical protein